MVGMTSIMSGIIIHAIQNITEDIKNSLIAVIMKCTNFLSNYLWFCEYIEVQEYRTCIEENSCNDRMRYEIDLITKCIDQQTDQKNAQYIC